MIKLAIANNLISPIVILYLFQKIIQNSQMWMLFYDTEAQITRYFKLVTLVNQGREKIVSESVMTGI